MKDQVDAARANGIRAACVNSLQPLDARREAARAYRSGQLDLLYLAPERLASDGFLDKLRTKHDVERQLVEFLRERDGQSGIVYRTARRSVDATAALLRRNGIKARRYHAGIEPAAREATQETFIRDNCAVIVATIAFGMGIDKPDVRFVVHGDLPKNLESYYQETGRAGEEFLAAIRAFVAQTPEARILRIVMETGATAL